MKEVLDYACFKCPEQDACKKMIDEETDKVFDFIQNVVDPETVCTGLRVSFSHILQRPIDSLDLLHRCRRVFLQGHRDEHGRHAFGKPFFLISALIFFVDLCQS